MGRYLHAPSRATTMNEALGPPHFALLAFSSLVAVINPVSAAPMFVAMTPGWLPADRRRAAVRACLSALAMLIVFAVAGGAIFAFFGITVPAFQITGGILFLLLGLQILNGEKDEVDKDAPMPADPSIVPLGIPLIAGPGAISTTMVLVGQASQGGHRIGLAAAIVASLLVTFLFLLAGPLITDRIGPTGQKVTNKIMGLIEAVIGIQFVINGVTSVAVQILQQAFPRL